MHDDRRLTEERLDRLTRESLNGAVYSHSVERSDADGALELRVELGFTGGPGFNAEGLVYRADGTVVKGLSPVNAYVPLEPGDPPRTGSRRSATPHRLRVVAARPRL